MALTTAQTNNKGIKFRQDIIREFRWNNVFSPYMDADGSNIIRTYRETGKFGGDTINLPLVAALRGSAIGTGTLTGNEESIDNYGFRMWLDWARNAVRAQKSDLKKVSFDLWATAKPLLSEWGRGLQRDEIIDGFMAIPTSAEPTGIGSPSGQRVNGILWSAATSAQKDQWQSDNSDRVLYGNAVGNMIIGNNSASMTNVTAATGKLSGATLRVAKELAEKSDYKITPLTTDDGYERYVMFVGSRGYRDLWADPEVYQANKDARAREGSKFNDNPIFKEGDLLYDSVIVRKIPEIDKRIMNTGAGGSGVDVAPAFLCGKTALALLYGQYPEETKLDDTDYEFQKGIGIEMAYGVGKVARKTKGGTKMKDWGVVTCFNAAPPTA